MAWIQINIIVEEALAESLSDTFMDVGACSVTFEDAKDQPIYEPEIGTTPIWNQTKVIGLFGAELDSKNIIDILCLLHPSLEESAFKVEQMEDKDWIRAWMGEFKPMCFGDRLWKVRSWTQPSEPDAVNLLLHPGMAFGTGTHPTTAQCLTWLDQNTPTNLSVIDYGCGSGVLALAASKLGAKSVVGTDIDPQAITASIENARRNDADISFKLVKDFDSEPVDLLIANILAGPLKELAEEFDRLLKPGGTLVLSGLLTWQAKELQTHYQTLGITLNTFLSLEEWGLLAGTKQA